jgi:hypothetical protein
LGPATSPVVRLVTDRLVELEDANQSAEHLRSGLVKRAV